MFTKPQNGGSYINTKCDYPQIKYYQSIRTGVIPYSYKTTNTANNPLGLIYLFLPIYNK